MKNYKLNVSKITIKSVNVQYDARLKYQKYDSNIILTLTWDTGHGFDKELSLFGNFNKDKNNWGSAWYTVGQFLTAAGISKPQYNDDWSIPSSYTDQVIGKEIQILEYPTTKVKDPSKADWDFSKYYWNIYPTVFSTETNIGEVKDSFIGEIDRGYKKYDVNTDIPDKPREDEPQEHNDAGEDDFDFAELDV